MMERNPKSCVERRLGELSYTNIETLGHKLFCGRGFCRGAFTSDTIASGMTIRVHVPTSQSGNRKRNYVFSLRC